MIHFEFVVVHREFRTKIEHALEFTDLRGIEFRLVVHEVSTEQNGPSDIFSKRWSIGTKG